MSTAISRTADHFPNCRSMDKPQPTPEKGITAGNITGDDIVIANFGANSSGNVAGKNINYYNISNAPATRTPLWVNVPSLPQHFLGRDELVADLVARLTQGQSPALTTNGMPGVGKTALATVLAHHPEVLKHFCDGVLWGGLGTNPDVMSIQGQWATALGINLGDEPDVTRRQTRINAAVGQQKVLIVLDDAWDLTPAKQLRCTGPYVGHILTTRNRTIAVGFSGAQQAIHVPELEESSAYALLRSLAPDACAASPAEAEALAKRGGGLPLGIEMLGGYLAAPERSLFPDLSHAAFKALASPTARLALARERLGAERTGVQTLQQMIQLSLEELEKVEPKAAEVLYCLGAFAPKPAMFTRAAAIVVAECTTDILALLASRNLIDVGKDGLLALHQVVAESVAGKVPIDAVRRHKAYYLGWKSIEGDDRQTMSTVSQQIVHVIQHLECVPEPITASRLSQLLIDNANAHQRTGKSVHSPRIAVSMDDFAAFPTLQLDPDIFGFAMQLLFDSASRSSQPHAPIMVRGKHGSHKVEIGVTTYGVPFTNECELHLIKTTGVNVQELFRKTLQADIGLAICKRLCTVLGGDLIAETTAQSVWHNEVHFNVILPIRSK